MIRDLNVSINAGENAQQLKKEDLKGGVRKEDIKDEILRSIFDKLDDGNGILEQSEMEKFQEALVNAAKQDGDETNLSKKEAKAWLKALGLGNIDVSKMFEFLGQVKQISANIDYSTRDVENPDEIIVVKKKDADGKQVTEIYDDKDGSLNRTIEKQQNGTTLVRDIKNNTLTGVDKDDKKFTRTQNKDGGYTDKYESGVEITYDKDGKKIGGKLANGTTFTVKYNDDGSYTITLDQGEIQNYDKDGKMTDAKLPDGKTVRRTYNQDGSYVDTLSNGEIQNYDKDGKMINGKLANGTTFTVKYNKDGSYTQYFTETDGSTYEYSYDKDGREVSGKNSKGITWTRTYNTDGSSVKTWSDGEIDNYDKDGKRIGGKLANGTTFTVKYNKDGSYTQYFTETDGSTYEYSYDKDGREVSGKNPGGITWTRTYNTDGSSVRTWSDGQVDNYDKDGKMINGKLASGTTFTVKYGDDGKLKYKEFTQKDGSKYYWGADGKSYAKKTANGNFKAHAKQGETFNDTMLRLGITDPKDQQIFIKANPKAYQRGYFLLSKPDSVYGDVYIPKEIADKLDMENILVDSTAEYEKHKQEIAKKKPSYGL
ncbi:MAG: hypothetical protein MJ237_01820 [bacterium]|nr:hypothetical protein [bacterium]